MYKPENIERVRRDEAEAQTREAEQERLGQDAESDRRLAILRGHGDRGSKRASHGAVEEEAITSHQKRLKSDTKPQTPNPTSNKPFSQLSHDTYSLIDQDGHINLVPGCQKTNKDVTLSNRKVDQQPDPQGMRLVDAAGYGNTAKRPWYNLISADGQYEPSRTNTNVWGNEDPRRQEREKKRMDSSDPLAAMKRGVKQLRKAETDREEWKAERESDLNEVEELARMELRHRTRLRRPNSDSDSLNNFDLDSGYREDPGRRDEKSSDQQRHRHHHRHRRRRRSPVRDRTRSRSPRRQRT